MMIENISLEDLKSGQDQFYKSIYQQYRNEFCSWAINKYDLSTDELVECFQESMIIFYEKVMENKFNAELSTIKTYLFAIGKNKIREFLRKNNREISLDDYPEYLQAYEHVEEKPLLSSQELKIFLGQLGDPCRDLLINYYYKQLRIKEIAEKMGYKNTESAKNQKYKCLQRLRKMINDPKSKLQ